jgi:hypothetical protein
MTIWMHLLLKKRQNTSAHPLVSEVLIGGGIHNINEVYSSED